MQISSRIIDKKLALIRDLVLLLFSGFVSVAVLQLSCSIVNFICFVFSILPILFQLQSIC